MVNLFFAPFKNMTTQQRIDRALERLRQRYGVLRGFVSESKVAEVRNGPKVTHTVSSLKSFKVNLHSFRFSFVFIRFFTFLLLLDKVCAFSSAFLCVHVRTNQTVTCWTKVFRKKFFCKGVQLYFEISLLSFIHKIFGQNFYPYITIYLVRIWTYKNADEKAHTFSRRSKNVKKWTKTYEKRILCKFTFNEDLITLEVFAYGHNQVEKLPGQLLLDTANRLPANLKRRYLDKIDKSLLDLNQPSFEGFELLRKFVAHEIKLMTSDYAQALFKTEEKDKSRPCKFTVRVRQTAVFTTSKPNNVSNRQGLKQFDAGVRSQRSPSRSAVLPECFVCSNKHYLADCNKFKVLPTNLKRQTVFNGA